MPAIRLHDPDFDDVDDDDLPPLVDNPNPSMTFTFSTDMTPITYSTDPTSFEILPDAVSESSPLTSPVARSGHNKRRDSSYIPRPPNAFILFRSSFIRSQQVPGKVEGNHSTLSKIVGMLWKTLPREEREIWEAKALVAQAEHRKRYPDWRFRPGANALAKLKVKDGGGAGNHRKRAIQVRKTKDDDAQEKGRIKEERCAKIADLLVEGKKGLDLAKAVREWEGDSKGESKKVPTRDAQIEQAEAAPAQAHPAPIRAKTAPIPLNSSCQRCQTPDGTYNQRQKIPLTSMFRRSLSAPAGYPYPEAHSRTLSLGTMPALSTTALELPCSGAEDLISGPDALSPTSLPLAAPVSVVYGFPSNDLFAPAPLQHTLSLPTFYDMSTPSPPEPPFLDLALVPQKPVYPDYTAYPPYQSSTYSTLQGWAGTPQPFYVQALRGQKEMRTQGVAFQGYWPA